MASRTLPSSPMRPQQASACRLTGGKWQGIARQCCGLGNELLCLGLRWFAHGWLSSPHCYSHSGSSLGYLRRGVGRHSIGSFTPVPCKYCFLCFHAHSSAQRQEPEAAPPYHTGKVTCIVCSFCHCLPTSISLLQWHGCCCCLGFGNLVYHSTSVSVSTTINYVLVRTL
jgi:hypothetical protein